MQRIARVVWWIIALWPHLAVAGVYTRAVEEEGNVKNKLFPKKSTIEIALPSLGVILNQSYIESLAFHMGVTYYPAENWGLSLETMFASNSDKSERFCIENFYNDFDDQIAASCPDPTENVSQHLFDANGNAIRKANFGPAYVAIREIDMIITGSFVWAPIYGKQLALLTQTLYFDLFFTSGIGLTMSTFYPKSTVLRNGHPARGTVTADEADGGCPSGENVPGVCPGDSNWDQLIGTNGRPEAESHVTPTLTFGIGQKLHFLEKWHMRAEVRNYTLIGTHVGIETFFTLWAGIGVRF